MRLDKLAIQFIYNSGDRLYCVLQEDFETALLDVSKYTEEDKNNPYCIKEIIIRPKSFKEG